MGPCPVHERPSLLRPAGVMIPAGRPICLFNDSDGVRDGLEAGRPSRFCLPSGEARKRPGFVRRFEVRTQILCLSFAPHIPPGNRRKPGVLPAAQGIQRPFSPVGLGQRPRQGSALFAGTLRRETDRQSLFEIKERGWAYEAVMLRKKEEGPAYGNRSLC